jgi:hypothetical protein
MIAVATAGPLVAADPEHRWFAELEAGATWQSRNDVRIPGDTGTEISLIDLVGEGPEAAARVYLGLRLAEKHDLRLLVAPFEVTGTGTLAESVDFDDEVFAPGVPTEARYRFDSYRLSYRYRFFAGERWTWRVGFTAKVRDAEISLSQFDRSATNTDTGFVPLLHLSGDWRIGDRWQLELDLDAAAASQGRAEDLALKVRYDINERWSVAAGYRTVEGGADNDEVYAFAWLHSAVVSLGARF